MAATSFQYKYPLSIDPRVADQNQAVIYPWGQWADNYSSGSMYIYGRQLPERSYFGEDLNLSARPITRVIQPYVLEYAPLSCPFHGGPCECARRKMWDTRTDAVSVTPVVVSPVLNNRFAAMGSQVSEQQQSLIVLLLVLAVAGVVGFFVMRRRQKE